MVVCNKSDYIEGLKHLDAPMVYRKLNSNTTSFTRAFIMKFLKNLQFNSWLPSTFVEYCTPPEEYRTSQLYFLKKIHKNPMGIRPIVSSVNSITENISSFVDFWLQPLVKRLPSFLKDTQHFVNLISGSQQTVSWPE